MNAVSASVGREILRRPLLCVAIVFLAVLFVSCVFAGQVAPQGPEVQELLSANKPPSAAHLLGTDNLGRDVFSRLLFGGRVTLLLAAQGLGTFVVIGVPVGLLSGYAGGRTDRIIMWLSDLALSLPGLIILLVVAAVFPSRFALMFSLGVMSSPGLIRVTRAATLSIRARLYVKAAEVVGLSRSRVIGRHVLPAVSGPILVQVTVFTAAAVVIEAALGYLNLDVKPPAPSWGSMIADAAQVINLNPWLVFPSGGAIVLTCVALGIVGDAIREITASRATWQEPEEIVPTAEVSETAGIAADLSDAGDLLGPAPAGALLSVRDLSVTVTKDGRSTKLVDHVSFDLEPGECLGIVGESGCGKTMMALAVLGLLPADIAVSGGSIIYDGKDLRTATPGQRRALRGREIAFISQEPMLALDPGMTVGGQLKEVVRRNQGISRKASAEEARRLLAQVQLPHPEQVLKRYPHELSGGMAQRVCIALSLAGRPQLLIADEPTTALDVTVQAEILDLLRSLQETSGMAVMIVSHDCGVIADACDRVAVMYAGQVVELADVDELFARPMHPYSAALLAANPHRAVEIPLPAIPGRVPVPALWPVSCRFADRCPYREEACTAGAIMLRPVAPERMARCLRPELASAIRETVDA